MIGLGLRITRQVGGLGSDLRAQVIAALFGSGEQGALYDPSDLSTLHQDSAGTTPVTADGQPVGRMEDLSGNDNHVTQSTAAARPLYRTDGTLHWLEFDGVDDGLITASDVVTDAGFYAICGVSVNDSSGGSSARAIFGLGGDGDNRQNIALRSSGAEILFAELRIAGGSLFRAELPNPSFSVSTAFIAEAYHEASVIYLRKDAGSPVNNAADAEGASSVNQRFFVGSTSGYEQFFYGGAHVTSEVLDAAKTQAGEFFAEKSGVTL